MDCVIIAGGKASRLGLQDIPKSMVTIEGRPIIEYQILLAKRYGIKNFFILSGRLSHVITEYFGNGEHLGVHITHLVEPFPLGTAGSVKLVETIIQDRFLLFYGDIVMNFAIDRLLTFDEIHSPCYGTLVVHPNDHPYDSDLIEIDKNYTVTAFFSKPHSKNFYCRNLVNAGVYILDPLIFNHIPSGLRLDFGQDIFPSILNKETGCLFSAYETPEYIKDMGTQLRLEQVSADVKTGKVAALHLDNPRPAIFLDRDGVICNNMNNSTEKSIFTLLPGVAKAISKINQSEKLVIVVTNQPGIAKGFFSEEDLLDLHAYMETLLGKDGAYINAIFYCPHHPEKGFYGERQDLKYVCTCRKPNPGMLFRATEYFNIDMEQSWMIGDNYTDIFAGKAAGCKTVLIAPQDSQKSVFHSSNLQTQSLEEAIITILSRTEVF